MASKELFLPFGRLTPQSIPVYCFPYEGGNAEIFASFAAVAPPPLVPCGVHFPGRPPLDNLPLTQSLADLVSFLVDDCALECVGPTIFYGHGIGAVVAFEVCRRLRSLGKTLPQVLLVAAQKAPNVALRREVLHTMTDDLLMDRMRYFPETPLTVFNDPGVSANFLPIFRADLALDETYVWSDDEPLSIPIVVVGGANDSSVTSADLAMWQQHTTARFTMRLFPEGYVFSAKTFADIGRIALAMVPPIVNLTSGVRQTTF